MSPRLELHQWRPTLMVAASSEQYDHLTACSEALLRLYLRYGLGFHAGCAGTGWQRFLTPPGASAFAHQNLARQIAHHYWSAQQVRWRAQVGLTAATSRISAMVRARDRVRVAPRVGTQIGVGQHDERGQASGCCEQPGLTWRSRNFPQISPSAAS